MPLRSFSIKYFWKGMRFVSHLWFEMDNWKKTRSAGCREIHFVKLIACYENLSLDVCATIIGPKLHRICTGRPATPCFVLIRESDSPGPYQFRVERSLPDERPHTEKDVEQWAGRAHVRAPARASRLRERRLRSTRTDYPKTSSEAVAHHEERGVIMLADRCSGCGAVSGDP